MDFYEYEHRLVAIADQGQRGWALSQTDGRWRPVAPEFAGRVWADGAKISAAEAKLRYGFAQPPE